ncbi:glycoside hydrolase family 19 protein, partial [Arthrospira platensis SPKY1]|nr:glycoside hydrolase family 19 protein [Arthrospira platensis SPKY1]
YAGRLGNGSAGSGDGWRYRGRGLIQITGRANYEASGAALGVDLIDAPELLEWQHLAALSAAEWWHRHGCNQLADTGDLAAVTRKVNGGLTGLDDRLRLYNVAINYLGAKK